MDVATDPSDVLDLIGQPRRIDIIEVLIRYRRDHPGGAGLSFSDLFERSGLADKGTFNYHLDQLRGHFIEKHDDKYQLTAAGTVVAGALVAGTYGGESVEIPVDHACSVCGADIVVAIEPGQAEIRCRDGHRGREGHLGMTTPLPPGIASGRSGREVLELTNRHYRQMVELALNGTCIQCYGPVDGNFEEVQVGENTGYAFEVHCDRCGHLHRAPAMALALQHPAVVNLCHDHGIDVRETPAWELPFLDPGANVEVHPSKPFRIEVTVPVEGETVHVTFDRSGDPMDISE